MKITEVRTRVFEFPHHEHPFAPTWQPFPSATHRLTLVEVVTDAGITGIGAGGVATRLNTAAPFFVGQDPLDIERHAHLLRTITYFMGRPWAVEVALWDIAGKVAGLPLYRLLGGHKSRVRAYASTGELRPPEQRVDDVLRLRDEGFTAVKLRFHSPDPRKDIPTLEAVRKAVGDSLEIMVDANQAWNLPGDPVLHRWDLQTAVMMAREMEAYGVYWLEEPLWAYDYDGLAALRRQVNLRIAGGELNPALHEFRLYLEKGCYDVYQPDATFAGGISGARKVAGMAEAAGLVFSPHTWSNGIGLMANLHVASAVPNCSFIEYPYDPPSWTPEVRDFLLTEPIRIDSDGYVNLPDRPGLGIELDEEKLKRYELPPDQSQYLE
jgi:L-alanine-DL-glutamate epimerase-like enolase superfamily enzyme